MNLLLIFGGISYEHDISIKSFLNIFNNLDTQKYNISVIYITKEGKWLYLSNFDEIRQGIFKGKQAFLSPDTTEKAIFVPETSEKIKIDCIFPVVHGKTGEDGSLQGLFELTKIPYVGCKISASANSLDKSLTKIVVETANVKQNPYIIAKKHDFDKVKLPKQIENLKFPLFIKCASGGSSVGVYKAFNLDEVFKFLDEAFRLDNTVLIEQGIIGREVEVAVLGNENPIASTVGEIATDDTFYTFDSKYNDDTSKTFIPARISSETIEKVRLEAIKVYKSLNCSGLSRVDFFVTENEDIVFNEINTLPGFTNISMYPKLFEHEGISYSELLDKLIDFAIKGGGDIG